MYRAKLTTVNCPESIFTHGFGGLLLLRILSINFLVIEPKRPMKQISNLLLKKSHAMSLEKDKDFYCRLTRYKLLLLPLTNLRK